MSRLSITGHDGPDLAEQGTPIRRFKTGATRNSDHGKHCIRGFRSRAADHAFYDYMHKHRVQADGTLRAGDNWKKGIPVTAYLDGLDRHHHDVMSIAEYGRALRLNEDGSQIGLRDALCAQMFNVNGLLHRLETEQPASGLDPEGWLLKEIERDREEGDTQ